MKPSTASLQRAIDFCYEHFTDVEFFRTSQGIAARKCTDLRKADAIAELIEECKLQSKASLS